MAGKNTTTFTEDFAFYQQLWFFYDSNRGKIRSRYNDLTKKFLCYNDCKENPDAFLRQPQFEALEMYVFIKEFKENSHMYQIFDDWRKHENKFAESSYYSVSKDGQQSIFTTDWNKQNEAIFKHMKKYKEDYPN